VCVVDAQGKILKEAKVASEPEALIAWFAAHGTPMARIGLEAGPLSQWLFAGMKAAGLAVELLVIEAASRQLRYVRVAGLRTGLGFPRPRPDPCYTAEILGLHSCPFAAISACLPVGTGANAFSLGMPSRR